jgi:hypothetical protein
LMGIAAAVVRVLVEVIVAVVGWVEVIIAIVDWAGGSAVRWGGVWWCAAIVPVGRRGTNVG